ncbi:hypothetical protein E3_1440 [Rhodococcus phage E3]|uniref:hypothetical protein n=1 Tax=Rhodococcus phage E3 TaxID=1007869 RepID=UPI0002C6E0EF|nr:hypothetical protein M176_gp152 [Rhodococcus phage E3]AEQ21060.1 hypothetical protein E3_1440 [Rhodococcus phage E3]
MTDNPALSINVPPDDLMDMLMDMTISETEKAIRERVRAAVDDQLGQLIKQTVARKFGSPATRVDLAMSIEKAVDAVATSVRRFPGAANDGMLESAVASAIMNVFQKERSAQ